MDENWIKTFSQKGFEFDRVATLLIALFVSTGAIIGILIPFINNYTRSPFVHWGIIILVESSILLYWYYNRSIFPKGKAGKQNLIIAITTEDSKQKIRITKDFASEIRKQLLTYGLDTYYNVITLNNSLSEKIQRKIQIRNESIRSDLNKSEGVDSFLKTARRLKAKFFVYGDLIRRNEGNSTYFMSIEALIMHAKTNDIDSKTLHEEFSDLWKREITFLEADELNGFRNNANHIFFTATYMLGLATLVDNRFEQGIQIWESLEKYIKNNIDLSEFTSKIIKLKYQSYLMLSRLFHFQGDYVRSIEMRERYHAIIPNDYDALMNEAIKQVTISDNSGLALELIEKARPLAGDDGTWKYNMLYLWIKSGDETTALMFLDDILTSNFKNEVDVINQVTSYNYYRLRDNADHIQTHFIVGVLIYKKLNNPTMAYEHLVSFAKLAEERKIFDTLKTRANQYVKEIHSIIGV